MALLQVATFPHKAAILHLRDIKEITLFISISHNLADTTIKQVVQTQTQQTPPQIILLVH
jgi:hypothetical protein